MWPRQCQSVKLVNRKTQARLDPRDPLVLDTRELGRRPGSMRRLSFPVLAPAGFALELIGVPAGAQLHLDLRLESVMEGVLVTGTVTAALEGECSRCLGPVTGEVVADVQELFAYPDSTTEETTEDGEVSRFEGDFLDLEPVVRDAVVLALPLVPLCREDCAGLCATCGERWDELPTDHLHEAADPRWAALAKLQDDSQES
ncbi:MAG: DNA-binding protein [Pseudonocardiales bacterium]|nr:MAG: DNA-binding protein [Pseudonocardiales bacterium]